MMQSHFNSDNEVNKIVSPIYACTTDQDPPMLLAAILQLHIGDINTHRIGDINKEENW